jgi:class 3 adenylate cyclase
MIQTIRRLAAILAADVAGYSRLIGADEGGTLQRLRAVRDELIDPMIATHHGRLVKTTGDGLLIEFGSVIDGLRCATEIQAGMTERNATAPPDERIEFRMGLNVGDVVVEDGDIFGDGVNVAARLEGLAEPAGSASPRAFRRMPPANSILRLRTWGSRASRISSGRCVFIGSHPPKHRERKRLFHYRTSPRSSCCRSRT